MRKYNIILLLLLSELMTIVRAQDCFHKKGIGTWNNPKAGNHWIDSLNVSWYYNWDFKPPSDYHGKVEFVPMIWGDYDYYTNDATTSEEQATMEEQARYLFEVIKALDSVDYVERHAWFAMWDGHWENNPWPMYIVDENKQKLTIIGETMRYVCHRDSFREESGDIPEVTSISSRKLQDTAMGNSGISKFPNPFYDDFKISSVDNHVRFIEIESINGIRVLKKNINHNSDIQINLEQFEAGIYIVKIISENSIRSFKIIKLI